MIPDTIWPGQAPGGVVCIAFDLDDNEVTRSHAIRPEMVMWQAEDAGTAVNERRGGSLAAYDGDTGERMFKGPKIVIDEHGDRMPVTHHIHDLTPLERIVRGDGHWPWQVIGVFPAREHIMDGETGAEWWHNFCYTAGLSEATELWCPCASIEERNAGPELAGEMLNFIACGVVMGMVVPGDSVIVPLGVAGREDDDDVNSIWWIGEPVPGHERHQVNMTRPEWVIPVLWSSPLGWKEATLGGADD